MDIQLSESHGVRLAIEGCGHGTLHAIYASVAEACKRKSWPSVDLLIIGGDFQAVRNAYDLNCVSMPPKYRAMCDFHEYYSGTRTAPYLTLFVGGNHEASNYLFELYYGGWVAPRIYYMGAANVLRLGPLRIVGLSGIWKGYNYRKPHFERLPYNESDLKSIYHVRELDVRKLLQIRSPVDIGISHDWPRGVEWKGNWKQLFRFKPHFEEDAKNSQLGSAAAKDVMEWLRPRYWFSAHLHAKFAAIVNYGDDESASNRHQLENSKTNVTPAKNTDEIDLDMDDDDAVAPNQTNGTAVAKNDDEIDLDEDDDTTSAPAAPQPRAAQPDGAPTLSTEAARAALPAAFHRPPPPVSEPVVRPAEITNQTTHFLALDKCLPNRHFLQLMSVETSDDIDKSRPLKLTYDREWLVITRSFAIHEPLALGDPEASVPRAQSQAVYQAQIDEQRSIINKKLTDEDLIVPENFEVTSPVYDGGNWNLPPYDQVIEYPNPQTARFCQMLDIANAFDISDEERTRRLQAGPRADLHAEKFGHGGRGRGQDRSRGRGRGRGRGDRGRGWGHRGR